MWGRLRGGVVLLAACGCREAGAGPGFELIDQDGSDHGVEAAGEGSIEPTGSEGGAFSEPAGAPSQAGDGQVSDSCGAQPVTLDEVHAGLVRAGIALSLGELSATSQKFLVSEAKSGSCLWGAFAAEPGQSGAGSGLLLVSFGPAHAQGQACQAGGDGLPDDLAAGDRLEVQGFLDEYAPSGCAAAPAQQLRVDAACPVRRVGVGAAPEPVVIDVTLADKLAAGQDRELLRAWSGALVRLESVSARQDPDDLDAVFPFGVIELEQTALQVHSRLYYFDLSQGGPRAPGKAPSLSYPTELESVTGVVFLDYCTWALGPRDRCLDSSPPSAGCGQALGP